MQPAYYHFAYLHHGLVFLDMPVINHITHVNQGLDVTSLHYVYAYYPYMGLVKELIFKKYFFNLIRWMHCYAVREFSKGTVLFHSGACGG